MPPAPPNEKLALPAFLKVLTAGGLSASKSMAVAGKIYKTHGTPDALAHLGDAALVSLHVSDKEERRLVLAAVKKAGYHHALADPVTAASAAATAIASKVAGPSTLKKRKRQGIDEYGPAQDEAVKCGNFDFKEESDEKIIKTKVVHVNRSPVMTAWAMVVAERMGFKREEALSIASAYTEMNATSKGISLGLFDKGNMEATPSGGQPYVELMGRKPVYSTRESQWRALLKGEPISPTSAFQYITHAFQQQAPHVVGAMRLLAETFAPKELNRVGFSLYADFRPQVDGWGKKGELTCSDILALRRAVEEPELKKQKTGLSVEEYEAALDNQDYEGLFSDPEDSIS